ncbi:MAG: sulfatase [Elusimicrobia bacterium]|nr:sulfatase [Elusimicrobiota bacterium]
MLPLLLLSIFLGPAQARQTQLNVVVVDICSARADHFSFYGYARKTTPGLEALAKESVVFDRAMAQSSWCLPNYATLLTGHVPEVHGQYSSVPFRPLPDFETTLAERMRRGGYKTAAFTGGIYFLPAWGLERGFETFVNYFSTATALPAPFDQSFPAMTRWIDKNSQAPFFLYATVDDLHAPYQSKDPDRYDPGYEGIAHDTATLSVGFFRAYNGEPGVPADMERRAEEFRGDRRHLRHLVSHYDAALAEVDRRIFEFVDFLKKKNLWDSSLVIITADHGELLGEHGLLGHTEGLYEPILRVPLILHHPLYPDRRGERVSELVERIDLTPTILDAGGIGYEEEELQGRSLAPLLSDRGGSWRAWAYASSKRNMAQPAGPDIDERVIRDKKWKLHWYSYKESFELYDLENDPSEAADLASARPEVVQRLAFELLKQVELLRPHAPGLPSGKSAASSRPLSRLAD